MMRIGILTASRTNNNGTDLQTAAMYKLFSEYCDQVEIIDYACKKLDGSRKLLPRLSAKNLVRLPWKVFDSLSRERFRKNAFRKSPKTYYPDTLRLDDYDAVVVGSDQIWNLELTGNDLNFFLPPETGNMQRCAYAPSLGKTDIAHWEELHGLSQLLSRFSCVSVRERSGVEALKQIGVDASCVLDPLLCLERSCWEQMAAKKYGRKNYVLLYLVQSDKKAQRAAVAYAKAHNLQVITVGPPRKPVQGIRGKTFVSIARWIRLVMDAKVVFTNSYHGLSVAVAVNTNVRVFAMKNGEANSRALCLLQALGLENCFLETPELEDRLEQPDWVDVNSKLQKSREASHLYIKRMLGL